MQNGCASHGHPIEYFSKKNNDELEGWCKICVVAAKSQIFLVDDLLKQIELKKFSIGDVISEQAIQNQKILYKLRDTLNNFKNRFEGEIHKIFELIGVSLRQIELERDQIQNELKAGSILLEKDLIQHIQSLVEKSKLNQYKQELSKLLENFHVTNSNQNWKQILQDFPQFNLTANNGIKQNEQVIPKQILCSEHNLEIIALDLMDDESKNVRYCKQCIAERPTIYTRLDDALDYWMNFQNLNKGLTQKYEKTIENFDAPIKQNIQKKLELLDQKYSQLKQKISELKSDKVKVLRNEMKKLSKYELDLSSDQDVKKIVKIIQFLKTDKNALEDLLQKFHQITQHTEYSNLDVKLLLQVIKETQKTLIQKSISNILSDTIIRKDFQYNIIEDSVIQQTEWCMALAINVEKDTVITGQDQDIRVFDFKEGMLKESQKLQGHKDFVYCLEFMKESKQFISGSKDRTIKIWKKNEKQEWQIYQTLEGHTQQINCLIIKNNNQIISGSADEFIHFWNLSVESWEKSQSMKIHRKAVCSFSLNEAQNKLISCGEDNLINVLEYTNEQNWILVQKIRAERAGMRLCFISEDYFAFQPTCSEFLQVYKLNDKEFIKCHDINVKKNTKQDEDFFFPQKFIKQKQILISKNGLIVDLIQKQENGELVTKQSIQFEDECVYGTVSTDGKYLLTWDWNSQKIKVHQYVQI